MFLEYLKSFVIKKAINKSLSANTVQTDVHKIKTVGVVVDYAFLEHISKLKQKLLVCGIREENIEIIVRKSQTKAIDASNDHTFNASIVSWTGSISDVVVQKFIEKEFDLLVNYYEQQKPVLVLVSSLSRASFKVGFAGIDKRVNNLIIDASASEYAAFDKELFKYLKILNTI